MRNGRIRVAILSGAAWLCHACGLAWAGPTITIPAEDLKAALEAYIQQSGLQIIYSTDEVAGLTSHAVTGVSAEAALSDLLQGTGLSATYGITGTLVIAQSRVAPSPLAPEEITVTGTRIPDPETIVPVTQVSTQRLSAAAPGSLPQGLDKLPVFQSGQNPDTPTTGANGRGGNAPGYFLNLRSLGANRTLILEDGRRVPGTFFDTTVDTNSLPQMLIDRVEIVTGGASAVYGSDAVTGVVNFILDKKFDGLKGMMEAGQSNYGDVRSLRLGVAGGSDIGEKGHLIWSVEYRLRDGLPDAASRPLGSLGAAIVGSGSASSPYDLVFNSRQANTAPGGLITSASSPGHGMQFNSAGQLVPFSPGVPTTTTNFSIGGDGGTEHNEYLLPEVTTASIFGHYTWDFSDSLSGFIEARGSVARSYEAGQIFTSTSGSNAVTGCTYVNGVCQGTPTVTYTNNGSGAQYPITIYSGNAFLTPAAQAFLFPNAPAACQPGPAYAVTTSTTSCPSFQMNRMNNDLMSQLSLDQHIGALAITAGLNGKLFGSYDWDFYYTHGETRTQLTSRGNVNASRFYAALDAVRDPATGNIVCNVSLTAPGIFPGCVPLNLFGQSSTTVNGSNASAAAIAYIGGPPSYWVAKNGLDDFGANVTGTAFDDWAGPIKFALGAEYRLASLTVYSSVPDNTFNPQYLRLAPPGTFPPTSISPLGNFPPTDLSRFKEVQSGADGSENVSEANFELDVPLLRQLSLAEAVDLQLAGRYTHYATGGLDPVKLVQTNSAFSATTWRVGIGWKVLDDLRLRATRSRDIRAPTLYDLYQGPLTTTSGSQDIVTGIGGSVNTASIGNPLLKPEVARNTTAGLVYTPGWLDGFSASADYFHIQVDREIAAISGASSVVQQLCLSSGGASPYCGLIQRPISYNSSDPRNFPTAYFSQVQNFQKQWTEGVDFEINFATDLSTWSNMDGLANLRVLWTHTSFLKTLGLPGSVITDLAGSNNTPGVALPNEKASIQLDYRWDGLTLDMIERYYSPINQNLNPTLIYGNVGDVPSYFITDVNVEYDFATRGMPFSAFVNISNLFDRAPDILQTSGYTGSPGMNYPVPPYEDVIGRYFTVGLRFKI